MKFIVSWMWQFQKTYDKMGWTYWLIFDSEDLAMAFLKDYVHLHFPKEAYQLKTYVGRDDYFSKLEK